MTRSAALTCFSYIASSPPSLTVISLPPISHFQLFHTRPLLLVSVASILLHQFLIIALSILVPFPIVPFFLPASSMLEEWRRLY